jgi:pyruvate dehydrogenase E2 component (dihydrolipoyllysine-residue acetyltransferase)
MKIITVKLPDVGEGIVEGEVIEWLKKMGDPVAQDEPVVKVMTDKATVELPSPHAGILHKQYYREGEVALVGKPLYDIEAAVLATPATRHLAKERGIDLSQVVPSGKDGRVMKEDLASLEDEVRPLHGIPKMMAKRMSASHREVVAFSYFEQVDATRLIQLKSKLKREAEGFSVTFTPLFMRALSLALKQYPQVNSSLEGESQILHRHHNIGIATSTPEGLMVPVIQHVEKMSLEQVIRAFDALKAKVLAGKLTPADMQGGTITISNYGTLSPGSLFATPVINYPEAAILGLAKIHKQPVVINDEIVIREMLNLSWTFDHRLIDGDLAAHFSHAFAQLIANPAGLI